MKEDAEKNKPHHRKNCREYVASLSGCVCMQDSKRPRRFTDSVCVTAIDGQHSQLKRPSIFSPLCTGINSFSWMCTMYVRSVALRRRRRLPMFSFLLSVRAAKRHEAICQPHTPHTHTNSNIHTCKHIYTMYKRFINAFTRNWWWDFVCKIKTGWRKHGILLAFFTVSKLWITYVTYVCFMHAEQSILSVQRYTER